MSSVLVALRMFLALAVLTGVLYPLFVTLIAQGVFPHQAGGSLIRHDGRIVGSELIGQPFASPRYFWSRPSATGPTPYNAAASSGSNLGPIHPALADSVAARVAALRAADPALGAVPVDLVTASGSGLDPHISVAAALVQAPRVARARGLREEDVRRSIDRHTAGRTLGMLGEPVVNVLELNLALDAEPAR
jgi:K+-transporting ATPase ATPase C chain